MKATSLRGAIESRQAKERRFATAGVTVSEIMAFDDPSAGAVSNRPSLMCCTRSVDAKSKDRRFATAAALGRLQSASPCRDASPG
jgi:hypothetical protein